MTPAGVREDAVTTGSVERIIASAASELDLQLGEVRIAALVEYVALLHRWNRVYNLSAIRDPTAMARLHIVDCLAAVPAIERDLRARGCRRVLDVGSGAGLPGVILVLALPEVEVVCVEPVGKKAAFIRQAAAALRLDRLVVEPRRVEQLESQTKFGLVVARAFGSIVDLIGATRPILADDGRWAAMKADRVETEVAALDPRAWLFHVEPLRVPGQDVVRRLVWVQARRPFPPENP